MAKKAFRFLYIQDYIIRKLAKDFSRFKHQVMIRRVVIDMPSNYIWDPIEHSLKLDLPWEDYRTIVARDS